MENRIISKLCRRFGVEDGQMAVSAFVNQFREHNYSLEFLARKLGVTDIIEVPLPFEGGVFESDAGRVIKLNAASGSTRKRFTLAHEIAHLMLETAPAQRKGKNADKDLERACDQIAAELLIPADAGISFTKQLGAPSPQKLREIARRFGVSLQVAAIRVREDLGLWKCSIGLWEVQPRPILKWFVGERRLSYFQPSTLSLEEALHREEEIQRQEYLRFGSETDPIWMLIQRTWKDTVLALLRV